MVIALEVARLPPPSAPWAVFFCAHHGRTAAEKEALCKPQKQEKLILAHSKAIKLYLYW
ncbi:MAG: hypothetical protein ACYSN8_05810 [Planctomycetota bacterium]